MADPTASLPALDVSQHTVPLEQVYFDTFDGGSVRLSEANEPLIARLRDAIPPIDAPRYETAAMGDWLDGADLVLGFVTEAGDAYAYPHKILNFHEIVNEEFDGIPVLISYCPLCRSGVVYDRRLEGRTLSFGNTSALYESDLVMFDRETNSYWWQVAGRAIVGALSGSRLTPLPSSTATWDEWKRLHPETLVLSRDTGYGRNYERDPFTRLGEFLDSGGEPFPISDNSRDDRLAPSAPVLGVIIGSEQRASPLAQLGDAVVNDVVGDRSIVILSRAAGPAGSAFVAESEGMALTFTHRDGRYFDEETGSEWDAGGRALSGPLAGARLEPVPTRATFWFAMVGAFPDARLYEPRSGG